MLTKPQVFYNHATRQALGFQNPRYLKKAQQLIPNLYDGSVIGKSDVIVVPDSENTLMDAEDSRSKMIAKQNDPQLIEKKVITKPIDYAIHDLSHRQSHMQNKPFGLNTQCKLMNQLILRNNSFSEQSAPTFDQLFEINDLKAQSQEKDTVIEKLKERLKSQS
nr:hypothetical protein [Tanacetum cinerariifolium]